MAENDPLPEPTALPVTGQPASFGLIGWPKVTATKPLSFEQMMAATFDAESTPKTVGEAIQAAIMGMPVKVVPGLVPDGQMYYFTDPALGEPWDPHEKGIVAEKDAKFEPVDITDNKLGATDLIDEGFKMLLENAGIPKEMFAAGKVAPQIGPTAAQIAFFEKCDLGPVPGLTVPPLLNYPTNLTDPAAIVRFFFDRLLPRHMDWSDQTVRDTLIKMLCDPGFTKLWVQTMDQLEAEHPDPPAKKSFIIGRGLHKAMEAAGVFDEHTSHHSASGEPLRRPLELLDPEHATVTVSVPAPAGEVSG